MISGSTVGGEAVPLDIKKDMKMHITRTRYKENEGVRDGGKR